MAEAGGTLRQVYPDIVGEAVSTAKSRKAATPKGSTTKAGPKWEQEARERLRVAIRKYHKPLSDLVARDANEGDTRLLVTDFLCDGLGYDKFEHLTTEYQVKGEFADYGIRIDKQLVAFIEVKRATTRLNSRHLKQVEMYSVHEGVEWAVLTNGAVWQVHHISGGLPVVIDLVLQVDLLSADPPSKKAEQLFYFTRESFNKRQIDEVWRTKTAISPKSLGQILQSEAVVTAIRKELKRVTGHKIEPTELASLLRETLLRPEALS